MVYNTLLDSFSTVQKLSESPESILVEIISPIGLIYLASRIKSTASLIRTKFNDKVLNTFDELIKLPGVGDYIGQSSTVLCISTKYGSY